MRVWAPIKGIGVGAWYVFKNILNWFRDKGRNKNLIFFVALIVVGFPLAIGGGLLAIVPGFLFRLGLPELVLLNESRTTQIGWLS
ncbi:MAG: hypothetical protein A2126_00045 [Candidatus Woykebacteria bacterium GWB1_45_5]|uniref:Uncharacterized protein n=2 Tax=Candidatus Woykeibacteriota TaxID=1817899 RepID=A0A1G1W0N2_9BACT|nr:MAG: hypothetical protein A2113_04475 [Candidatus Woykebacteria bacterium GWA1_44_8]OGY22497.1 MAG: hypothetical protein A2126_00045 [Candidatus Woykebacteria bacterium GWB1_45_5]